MVESVAGARREPWLPPCKHRKKLHPTLSSLISLLDSGQPGTKDKRGRKVLPPSNVREVLCSECTSWLVVNGTQRSDWWRELGVRRSARSSYKAADCYSSTDYGNLDLQQAKGACVWQAGCCCSVWGVQFGLLSDFFCCCCCCQKWVNEAGKKNQTEKHNGPTEKKKKRCDLCSLIWRSWRFDKSTNIKWHNINLVFYLGRMCF